MPDVTSPTGYVADVGGPWATLNMLVDEVPDLRYPQSNDVFTRMRRDPKLTALLRAVALLIGRATWAVEPAGASGAMASLVADDLGLTLAGGSTSRASAARARGILWPEHLRVALLDLVYGHCGFELEVGMRDGAARLVALHERLPQTIDYDGIKTDSAGRFVGIVQKQRGKTPERLIPAESLLWYAHEREGAAWQGQSLLRPAYGPWLIKHEMWRVIATGMRRNSMGSWQVSAPPGATPQQIAEAQQLASSIRSGETAGIGLPAGYAAELRGMVGSAADPLPFVKYLDQQMSQMVLAGFLDLGQTATGSRALGETFVDFFTLTVEAIANEVAAQVTRQVAVRLTDYNEGAAAAAPVVTVTDVGANHEVTAEALNSLVVSGVLTADESLEAYSRAVWRLPKRIGPRPAPVAQQPRVQPSEGTGQIAAAAGDGSPDGDPDTAQVDRDWRDALAALLLLWRPRRAAQADALAAQVAAAGGDVSALAGLALTVPGGPDLIASAMLQLAGVAAGRAVQQAAAQGVVIDVPDVGALAAFVQSRAAVVDALLSDGLVNAAVRAGLLASGESATGEQVAQAVRDALTALTDTYLNEQLGGALTVAQNEARGLVFDAAGGRLDYVSAIEELDRNTCKPCAAVAGTQYPDWAAARVDYPSGQYLHCKGGARCRGFLSAVYKQEAA